MKISVIIPTFNPSLERLSNVLVGLQNQDLPVDQWQLVIVDNASTNSVLLSVDLTWHPNHVIIREDKPGLTYARIRGFEHASADIIVLVDDDNVLRKDYLTSAIRFLSKNSTIGIVGGKALPVYEKEPPVWFKDLGIALGCRDLGDDTITSNFHHVGKTAITSYPTYAPIGTGMVLRKAVAEVYSLHAKNSSAITDRKGKSLSSGGDNEMVIVGINDGWEIGYFPDLVVDHLIPKNRLEIKYLARMNHQSFKSWVQLLRNHDMSPWATIPRWSVSLRKAKAYFTHKAWKNTANRIKWRGACGMYDGLKA